MAKSKAGDIILHKHNVVCVETSVRSNFDRRVIVDRHVVAYFDGEGNEYRKSFETYPGGKVAIPQGGYNKAINDWAKQWDMEIIRKSKATVEIRKKSAKPAARKTGTSGKRKAASVRKSRQYHFMFELPRW